MKLKITAKGFNGIVGTTMATSIETCVTPDMLDYNLGKLIYTLELSGFAIVTHNVFTEYKRNSSKLNFSNLTERYLPIVNTKYNDIKITISLAKA